MVFSFAFFKNCVVENLARTSRRVRAKSFACYLATETDCSVQRRPHAKLDCQFSQDCERARDVFGSGGRFLLQTFIKVRHEKNEGNASANGIALI